MKIAYFDTIGGISGDMTLGAFINAGIPLEYLKSELSKLNMEGYEIDINNVNRSGINATKINVIVKTDQKHHRHLKDINEIIESSSLNLQVKENAKKIFYELAKAEASVHNTTIEQIHFHEVGALDAIIDIVGTAICLNFLQIEKVYSSPIKVGSSGFIDTDHGKMPIPTPATVEILKDYPTILTNYPFELTTPTGAAIIKALSSGTLSYDKIIVKSIGYGAGTRDLEIPNLLRIFIAEYKEEPLKEELVVVETNIDDMNPEIYPYIIEKLITTGAHDACIIPIIMKKGRPGILLSALVNKGMLEEIINVIFSETSTLGVRIHDVGRRKVVRSTKRVNTSLGEIQVKVVYFNGKERLVPEFEECKRIAIEKNLPLINIYKIIEKEISIF